MKTKFNVTGMTCSACSSHVEKAVKKVDGVQSITVSLLTNSMVVDHDQNVATVQKIQQSVANAGYGASVAGQPQQAPQPQQGEVTLFRLVFSLVLCALLMYVAMGHMANLPLPNFLVGAQSGVTFALVQLLLCLPVWYVNRNYYVVGYKRLFKLSPNMDSLIAVGSTAGALQGIVSLLVMSHALGKGDLQTVETLMHHLYFEASATILALVNLGKFLEGKSKRKTGNALEKLKKLAPQNALLLVDGNFVEVDSATLKVGDVVAVKAGMSFPADGVVSQGNCFVNESAISGESMPVEKQVGNKVIGGTVNVSGYVQVEITTVGEQSVLSKIICLVEEAGASKAPIQKLADKISGVFVPVVLAISLVTFVVWAIVKQDVSVALQFAISVLVISCPCALGLATPVALVVATGKGAENGILIKNGIVLEKLAHVQIVALDKTGTVTNGTPVVEEVHCTMPQQQFLAIVAGIEQQSEHPLGQAVVNYAKQQNVAFVAPQSFQTLPGMGVVGTVDGISYAIGNAKLMQQVGVEQSAYQQQYQAISQKGHSTLIVAQNGKFVGIVGVGDQIKQSSAFAVEQLKKLGIKTVLITGDNKLSAQAIANQIGVDQVFAEVLPHQKQQIVAEQMKVGVTAMVGDGINDAPALATADVGFAVSSGSDVAVDSADVVLVKNDVVDVANAISLSKKTLTNIKQNLFWAFFYNLLGIPIAAGVLFATPLHLQLNPMLCAGMMSLSSVFVVCNALRLRFFKPFKGATTQVAPKETNVKKYKLTIEGMMCGHCTGRVHKTLQAITGVQSVEVSLENKCAIVECIGVDSQTLKLAVEQQDYPVTNVQEL